MSWKPSETDIIDYLYGEIAPDLKDSFEKYLNENPEFSKELDEIRDTMGILPVVPDEEVIPPVPLSGIEDHKLFATHGRKWLYPVSIAASIAFLLLVGYFTNFSISFPKTS